MAVIMDRLKEFRLAANMTQVELAEAADLDQATISRLEKSERHPHPRTLAKLAYALGVEPEELVPDLPDAHRPRPSRQMPDKVAKPLLSLVEALARKYARWNGERADLISAGQEGLWEAWSKFDPDRGVPFEKFAGPRIKWRVLDKVRQLHREPNIYGVETAPRLVREYLTGFGSTDKEKSQEE
jgi:transcriptional regulator with XRE-family HTH domain